MNKLKICITGMLLLISVDTFSQTKKHSLLPPPLPPEIKTKQPIVAPVTPISPELLKYGYPATRNGKNVWVMKPRPIKPTITPPPRPQRIKN
ncbi:MAG: hypothetical protein H0W12_09095 [Chitinophagaceae bacterium]|nr:hypothetical protein [Chitinophagaceae bacterium]